MLKCALHQNTLLLVSTVTLQSYWVGYFFMITLISTFSMNFLTVDTKISIINFLRCSKANYHLDYCLNSYHSYWDLLKSNDQAISKFWTAFYHGCGPWFSYYFIVIFGMEDPFYILVWVFDEIYLLFYIFCTNLHDSESEYLFLLFQF